MSRPLCLLTALVALFLTLTVPGDAANEPGAPVGPARISADDLRKHVVTLASDEYEGRDTLQPGAAKARAYIVERFEEAGLEPLPGREEFPVPYQLHRVGYDTDVTRIELTTAQGNQTLTAGKDFVPFPFSADGDVSGEVVFAGYGITAPEAEHDDYANLDVKDKVVLVLRHTPREKDPDHPLTGSPHAMFANKAALAQKNGAVAMLLVTDPIHHEDGDDLRLPGQLFLDAPRGGGRRFQGPGGGQLVAVHVSRPAAESIVTSTGKSLKELQLEIDNGGAPAVIQGVSARVGVARLDTAATVNDYNVIGCIEGSDPAHKDEWIVIGAHYDHVGAFQGAGDTVFNGADDNASGTSALMELADAFGSLDPAPARSIAFCAFSGEEKGLLGSRAMVRDDVIPREKMVFMLNIDMIGRNPERPVEVTGEAYSSGIQEIVDAVNADIGVSLSYAGTNYAPNSDHHPFYLEQIPFMFFFTGLHEDYHQLGDHADLIAYDRMASIVRLAYGVLERLARGDVTPSFIHHVSWLGVQVRVQETATGEQHAVVSQVDEGLRGDQAGIQTGDIITAVNASKLDDPRKVGRAFQRITPGNVMVLSLRRGQETLDVKVKRSAPGFLGVGSQPIELEDRQEHGLLDSEGLRLTNVMRQSPAAKAGLEPGDIIVRVAGEAVNFQTLRGTLGRIGAGELVNVVLIRDGERKTIELTLGARPRRRG